MRFFSRLVVICNLCFIAAFILRYVELFGKQKGAVDQAIPLPWLENTLVILGLQVSFYLNVIFILACVLTFFFNKGKTVAKWVYIFTGIVFAFQLVYFFTNLIP